MSIFDAFKNIMKSNKSLKAEIAALAKNEIVMKTDASVESLAPNKSKLGGKPWLPQDFVWPTFTSKDDDITRPLSFLCQINLEDVAPFDWDRLLPATGILYFFYEFEASTWGFDPRDKGSARVFYFEDTDGFAPMEWPTDIEENFIVPEIAVRFSSKTSYPSYEELEMHTPTECDWDDYDELLESMGVDLDEADHKLLGYANLIQGEMLTECERVSRGLYCGNAESYQNTPDDVKASIHACSKDWTLLLQLETLETDDWEWMWGDCGMLYFYIKKQDLAEKRFENFWFSLQCG